MAEMGTVTIFAKQPHRLLYRNGDSHDFRKATPPASIQSAVFIVIGCSNEFGEVLLQELRADVALSGWAHFEAFAA